MPAFTEFFDSGREALLAGQTIFDGPLREGGRWGASTVLRPEGAVLAQLAELAGAVGRVTGAGHWVHGPDVLHVTLRALEYYRFEIPADDPLRGLYVAALREAASEVGPVRVELRGVSPHAGGVIACGYPVDEALVILQKRFVHALLSRGIEDVEYRARDRRVRDRWYVSLMHFAGPVPTPGPIVEWCDEHATLNIGDALLSAVDLTHATYTGSGIRLDTMERVPLAR